MEQQLTKQDFIARHNALSDNISSLRNALRSQETLLHNLCVSYCDASPYQLKDLVIVTMNDGEKKTLFISSIIPDGNTGGFNYNFLKSKKDGTMSNRPERWLRRHDIKSIELIKAKEKSHE